MAHNKSNGAQEVADCFNSTRKKYEIHAPIVDGKLHRTNTQIKAQTNCIQAGLRGSGFDSEEELIC